MNRYLNSVSVPGILLAFLSSALAQTNVYIGVEGGKSGQLQWQIGMPPFQSERPAEGKDAKLSRQLQEVVRDDLMFSGYFKPVEPPSAAAAANPRAAADEWKKAGATFVAIAKVADIAPKFTLNAALLDLSSSDTILSRYYRQEAPFWRSVAHQMADDVTKQITGRPGIAHTKITFANDQTRNKEIYVMDYDGEGLRQLSHDNSIDLLPRWSPDRKRILYTSYRYGNPDLLAIDTEQGAVKTFSSRQGLNLAGGFSPDGTQLVLTLSMGKSPNIYLMDLGDRSIKPLTNDFGIDASPTFSPDGNQIAFVSDRSGNPQIHIRDLSSGRTQRLTRLNWCDTPSWSPTGEWIAFAGRANNKDPMDIFLVDITGMQIRQLTHGEGSNEDPSWSPDGRFLAFTSTRAGRRQVFVMGIDGSAPHPVGNIPGNSFTPAWSS